MNIKNDLLYAQFTLNKKWFVQNRDENKIIVTCNIMKNEGEQYLWGAEKYTIKICKSLSKKYEVHLFQQPGNFLNLKNIIVHSDMITYFSRGYMNKVARTVFQIKPRCIFCNAGGGQQVIFWSIISKMTNVPIIMFFHNEPKYIKNTFSKMQGLEYLFFQKALKDKELLYDMMLESCDRLGFLLPQYVSEKYKDKSYVFYNCIEIPDNIEINKKRSNILYVGRINRDIKRTQLLLDYIKDTYYECDVVGYNYANDGFLDISEYFKFDNIHFHGYQKNVEPFYRNAHVLVIPSIIEGLPTVALEAMSFGTPVIGYKECKSMNDIVIDGYNGWLVTDDLPASIRNSFCKDIVNIRKNCIKESKKYSIENIMMKIYKCIESV